ncbi:uncharacterized protein LOC134719237 [Mytilus trossulus]|uniref:uncharacterized protein LOC134719237 n=1 Tax=Mytilus trossulus TaxID=6551 RepID=UPI003005C807
MDCASMKVTDLKEYLRLRGIGVTNMKRNELVRLCTAVEGLNLPLDPDMCTDRVTNTVAELLKSNGIDNMSSLQGFTKDLSNIPNVSLYDVFNYLLYNTSNYDRRKLKAYKSSEDYRLYFDGYVESLEMTELNSLFIFLAAIKPTQKDKTYLNTSTYDAWIVMDNAGDVKAAYCTCIGGADGGCRHIGATLYEIEGFEAKSVTDGDNLWLKRARQHDCPVPIKKLKIMKARYSTADQADNGMQDGAHDFDPRSSDNRDDYGAEQMLNIARQLKAISPELQALDLLEDPSELDEEVDFVACDRCESWSMMSAAVNATPETLSTILIERDEVLHVERCTVDQSDNATWFKLRKGRITASNFFKVCRAVDNLKCPPSLMKSLLGEYDLSDSEVPSLEWGKRKEKAALDLYIRVNRHKHKGCMLEKKGLRIYTRLPYVGCSVDGLFSCKCHGENLVEVKCPFADRNLNPKEVAIKKGCVLNSSGELQVTDKCEYYHQIQGQMGIYGIHKSDLVVFTKKGIAVASATFDPLFFERMCKKFQLFFQNHLAKALISCQ